METDREVHDMETEFATVDNRRNLLGHAAAQQYRIIIVMFSHLYCSVFTIAW